MAKRIGLLLLFMLSTTWSSHARHILVLYQQEVSGNENVCTVCEEFAAQALDYLNDNKTQAEILQLLHESCSRTPTFKQQQCINLVEYYTPLFFLEVSSIQPSDFCQKVNLCEQMALLSTQVKEDSCQLCHQAVSEVLKKLKDPETQMGIIEMLMNICNSMEKKYVKQCKRMVFEYGPLVLTNAEQFLETQDLCTALHACRSDAISAQASSSDITIGLSEY